MLVKLKDVCKQNCYKQIDAESLEKLIDNNSFEVKLLPSSKNYDWFTSFKDGANFVCNGEIVTLGKARYANIKYWKGSFISANNIIIESNNKDLVKTKYLYYFLTKTSKDYYIETTSYPKFDQKSFDKHLINLPSIVLQNYRISNLDALFELINSEEKDIAKLNALIKSRFNEMFSSFPKVELHELANIIMGQSPKSSAYNDDGNGIPFFLQGKADYGEKYTTVNHYTKSWNKEAKKGYVLMSVRAPVGPVNIASCDCAIGRGLCSMNAKPARANNEFLYNALNSMQQEIVLSGKDGSTFASINKDQVFQLLLPNAPINLQNKFSDFVHHIDKLKF